MIAITPSPQRIWTWAVLCLGQVIEITHVVRQDIWPTKLINLLMQLSSWCGCDDASGSYSDGTKARARCVWVGIGWMCANCGTGVFGIGIQSTLILYALECYDHFFAVCWRISLTLSFVLEKMILCGFQKIIKFCVLENVIIVCYVFWIMLSTFVCRKIND